MSKIRYLCLTGLALSLAACTQTPALKDQSSNQQSQGVAAPVVGSGAASQPSPFDSSLKPQMAFGDCTVTPARVLVTLRPRASTQVSKNICIPTFPDKLDFMLVVDNTGSYGDDIFHLKSSGGNLARKIVDGIRSTPGNVSDSVFGLATFLDFSDTPNPYFLKQQLTFNDTDFITAVDAMTAGGGGDTPESQYNALWHAAVGPGGAAWRPDATRIIALTTDATFHDADTEPGYPAPGKVATIATLKAQHVQVIGLKAPGAGSELDDIVAVTGGAVKNTTSSSSDIVDAVLDALKNIQYPLTAKPVGNCAINFGYTPAAPVVAAGTNYVWNETITAPGTVGDYTCTVEFRAGAALLGTQQVTVRVR